MHCKRYCVRRLVMWLVAAPIASLAAFGSVHSNAMAEGQLFLPIATRGISIGSGRVLDAAATFEVDASALAASSDRLYLGQDHAIVVYDVTTPGEFTEVGRSARLAGTPRDLTLGNGTLVAALGTAGVAFFDLKDPDHPSLVNRLDVDGVAWAVSQHRNYFFVAVEGVGLDVFEASVHGVLARIATTRLEGIARSIDVNDGWAAIGSDVDAIRPETGTVTLVDVGYPYGPKPAGAVEGLAGRVVGDTMYVGSFDAIHVYDISDPDAPERIEEADLEIPGDPRGLPGGEHRFRNFRSIGDTLFAGTHLGVVSIDIGHRRRPEVVALTSCLGVGTASGLAISSEVGRLYVGRRRWLSIDVCSFEIGPDHALRSGGQLTFAPGAMIGALDGVPLIKAPLTPGDLDRGLGYLDQAGILALDLDRPDDPSAARPIPALHGIQSIVSNGDRAIGMRYGAPNLRFDRAIGVVRFDISSRLEPFELGAWSAAQPTGPLLIAPDGRTAIVGERWPSAPNLRLEVISAETDGPPRVAATILHVQTHGGIMAPGLAVLHAGDWPVADTRLALIDVSEPETPTIRLERYGGPEVSIASMAATADAVLVSGSDGTLVLDVADPSAPGVLGWLRGEAWTNSRLRRVTDGVIAVERRDGIRLFDVSSPLEPLAVARIPYDDDSERIVYTADGWISAVSGLGTSDKVTARLYRLRHDRP